MILSLRYSSQNSNQSKVFKINSVKCLTWGQIIYINIVTKSNSISTPELRNHFFMGNAHLSKDNCFVNVELQTLIKNFRTRK